MENYMIDYSGDLCDHFDEVVKRFNDGLIGTVQFGKMLSILSDNHKKSIKAGNKIKLKTESNMGFGEVMKELTTYLENSCKEEEEFETGLVKIRSDILTQEKELRKELQVHQKNEVKVAKKLSASTSKVQSCQKKDKADSSKWWETRTNLTEVMETREPIKKVVDKNSKLEKKQRRAALKSREAYEKSVEEWVERNEEYHDCTAEILGEVEKLDMKFMENKKKSIGETLEMIEKYHQKMAEMTKKLRLELNEKMNPEKFVCDYLQTANESFIISEEMNFEPFVENTSVYVNPHPAKTLLMEYFKKHPFECILPTRNEESNIDLSRIHDEVIPRMKEIPKLITSYLEEGAEHWHSGLDLRECEGFTAESVNEDRKIAEGKWIHCAFPRTVKYKKSKLCNRYEWNLKTDEEGNVNGRSEFYDGTEKQYEYKSEFKGRFISKRVVYSENVIRTNATNGAQSNSRMLMCFGNKGVVRVYRFGFDGSDEILKSFFAERWYVKDSLDQEVLVPGQLDTCDVIVE